MRATAAIVGPGNVGSDLLYKLLRCEHVEPRWMIGRDPGSAGLARARELGLATSAAGVDWLLAQDELPDLVFDATCATAHASAAAMYEAAGILAIDLTPAAVGPLVVPAVNLDAHLDAANLNMVTCSGQATVPIVHAIAAVTAVLDAHVVASIASRSAGPGTRANVDRLNETTARAIEHVGGARRGHALIVLDPADPPRPMRATVICDVDPGADRDAMRQSLREIIGDVAAYVPGYRLALEPRFDRGRVTVVLEVEGAGDFLERFSGNLDIITASAARAGDQIAAHICNDASQRPPRRRAYHAARAGPSQTEPREAVSTAHLVPNS
jgi:acetaldehyde dehydrogenase